MEEEVCGLKESINSLSIDKEETKRKVEALTNEVHTLKLENERLTTSLKLDQENGKKINQGNLKLRLKN